jgi:hypothetical protein
MEFKVFKGYCFWHAQKVARRRHTSAMRIFGFHSFAGPPTPQGIDVTTG